MPLAQLIDLAAFGKIVLVAICGGIGVTSIFGVAVLRGERLAARRAAGTTDATADAFDVLVIALAAVVCVAAVVVGVVAMTHK